MIKRQIIAPILALMKLAVIAHVLVATVAASDESKPFLIKHVASGKYVHPIGGRKNTENDMAVVLHSDIHENMYWTFQHVEDNFGYIIHHASKKVIHPLNNANVPGEDTALVIHEARHMGAWFAVDQVNQHIIHRSGKFIHPLGGDIIPAQTTQLVLHSGKHDRMRFKLVSPDDKNTEVLIYGRPKMIGKWVCINSVNNPRAKHTYTVTVTIGTSKSNSKKSSFEFGLEAKAGGSAFGANFEMTASTKNMWETASSNTWKEEKTVETQIEVSPGESVATWQYVFDVTQADNSISFKSNHLADTPSRHVKPEDSDSYEVLVDGVSEVLKN